MQMHTINIQWLKIEDIKVVTPVTVSKNWIKRRKKTLHQLNSSEVKIIVEYDEQLQKYWIIDGFQEFETYKSLKQPLSIPCFVLNSTTKLKRLLFILRSLVMTANSRTIDKYNCITAILEECNYKMAIKLIQENTGLTKEEIQSLQFHPDTPAELKVDLYLNRIGLFNKIQELRKVKLKREVRDALSYYAAQDGLNRLTYDKLDVINWMIKKTNGFLDLPIDRQIALIPFAAKFEDLLISQFQYFIDSSTFKYYNRFIYTAHLKSTDK